MTITLTRTRTDVSGQVLTNTVTLSEERDSTDPVSHIASDEQRAFETLKWRAYQTLKDMEQSQP
jgi:hypothetical protein